jgi:hypothetical protein
MSEESKEKRVRDKVVRENQLDFLEELKLKGIPLDIKQKNLLRKHRNHEELPKPSRKGIQRKPGTDDSVKSLDQISADKYIDVIEEGDELAGDDFVILDHEAYDKFAQSAVFKYQGGKDISIDDWLPKDKIHHTKEFTVWIDSLLDGFRTVSSQMTGFLRMEQRLTILIYLIKKTTALRSYGGVKRTPYTLWTSTFT